MVQNQETLDLVRKSLLSVSLGELAVVPILELLALCERFKKRLFTIHLSLIPFGVIRSMKTTFCISDCFFYFKLDHFTWFAIIPDHRNEIVDKLHSKIFSNYQLLLLFDLFRRNTYASRKNLVKRSKNRLVVYTS